MCRFQPATTALVSHHGCSLTAVAPPAGLSRSEGGFKANKVSAASVLDVQQNTDKKGKKYYKFELLSRTGQCHSLLTASTGSFVDAVQCAAAALPAVSLQGCGWHIIAVPWLEGILQPAPCHQKGDGEEAGQPAVCGLLCGSLPGAVRMLSYFLCSRWQAPPCCEGCSPLTDSDLSGLQLMAMRAAGTS